MKPRCDIEVKKSKSDVMLGLHVCYVNMLTLLNQNVRLGVRGQDILAATVYLNNRLSYGQGQEK